MPIQIFDDHAKQAKSARDPRKEPYLEKRGNIFWFVRIVPKDLREKIGIDRWRISLRTDSYALARELCRAEAVRTDSLIREARAPSPLEEAIRRLDFLPAKERKAVDAAGGLTGFMSDVGGLHMISSLARIAAGMKVGEPDKEGLYENLALKAERESIIATAKAYTDALLENHAILQKVGIQPNGEAAPIEKKAEKPKVIDGDDAPDRITKYLEIMIEAKQCGPEHADQLRVSIRRFVEMHGNLRIGEVNRTHMEEFRDAMEMLPYRTELKKHDRENFPVRDAIEYGRKHNLRVISKDAAQKTLDGLNSLFNFAVKEGKLTANPGFGVRVYKQKIPFSEQKAQKRLGFSPDELTRVNNIIEDKWGASGDRLDDLWLYRILLYSGARPEEIAQVELDDIVEMYGISVIRVRDGAGEDGTDLKIKNQYSLRNIPIHPKLFELGFTDFAKSSPGPRLFSSFTPSRNRFSRGTARRFLHLLRNNVKILDKRKVFYSLRHTFTTAMKNAGLTAYVQMALQGHGIDDDDARAEGGGRGSSIHAGYGEEMHIRMLYEAIAAVDPFSIPATREEIAKAIFSKRL